MSKRGEGWEIDLMCREIRSFSSYEELVSYLKRSVYCITLSINIIDHYRDNHRDNGNKEN